MNELIWWTKLIRYTQNSRNSMIINQYVLYWHSAMSTRFTFKKERNRKLTSLSKTINNFNKQTKLHYRLFDQKKNMWMWKKKKVHGSQRTVGQARKFWLYRIRVSLIHPNKNLNTLERLWLKPQILLPIKKRKVQAKTYTNTRGLYRQGDVIDPELRSCF